MIANNLDVHSLNLTIFMQKEFVLMHIRNSLKQQLCYREPTETLAYENVLSLQGQYP